MKVVENENAKKIIELLLPKAIRDLNPVIAGGFIVSLYYLAMRHSSPKLDEDLSRKIKRSSSNNFLSGYGSRSLLKYLELHKRFGDIDLWFLKDNDIWNEEHDANFLLDTYAPDGKDDYTHSILGPMRRSFHSESRKLGNKMTPFSFDSYIKNSSYWANSFSLNLKDGDSNTVQLIKKAYEDVDDLFSKFDIKNCCAAYYDGKFYFHDDFFDIADNYTLEMGSSFKKYTELSKIYSSSRLFKYAKRFDLEFSKDICDYLIGVYLDAEMLLKKINDGEYDKATSSIDLGVIDELEDAYGRNGVVAIDKLRGMIEALIRNFKTLVSMKHFDKVKLLNFVNSKDATVIKIVEKYVEEQSEEYQKSIAKLRKENNPTVNEVKVKTVKVPDNKAKNKTSSKQNENLFSFDWD
jgi:hypothetical protein